MAQQIKDQTFYRAYVAGFSTVAASKDELQAWINGLWKLTNLTGKTLKVWKAKGTVGCLTYSAQPTFEAVMGAAQS